MENTNITATTSNNMEEITMNKEARTHVSNNTMSEKETVNMKNTKAKVVRYSETLVKEIIGYILQGLSFEKIKQKTGVKTQDTIRRWIGIYYKVKKKWAKERYEKLLENNRNAKALAVKKAEEEKSIVVTYEDWFGSNTPVVDVLLDCRLTEMIMKRAIYFCETNGYSWTISKPGVKVNIEALLLGKPMIVSFSESIHDACIQDDIKFMWHYDLPRFETASEENDINFSRTYKFECLKPGKNGVFSCYTGELALEFEKIHSLALDSKLSILHQNKIATSRIGIKEGHELIFILTEGEKLTSWKYVFKGGEFCEIGYTSGKKASLMKFVKRA